MNYCYSLKDKNLTPHIGKLYRLLIDGDEATPIVVDSIVREHKNHKNTVIYYHSLESPDYIAFDEIQVFCEWYGEW